MSLINSGNFRMRTLCLFTIIMVLVGDAAAQLCGGQNYDSVADLCCDDVIQAGKKAAGELCCDDKSFDPRTHECKWGTISRLSIHASMTCFANGTIILMNDNPDLYVSATAMQGALTPAALQCAVDISENPKIQISGCPPSSEITLFLSSASTIDPDLVGGHSTNLRSIIVQCTGIPDHGINVTVHNFITALVTVPTVTYTASPYLVLESKIWNPETMQFSSQAMAGTALLWSILLPAPDYSGLPLTCTAYSGTSRAGTPHKHVISMGCSLKEDLIGDWSPVSGNGINGLSAPLWAFTFYNSPNVYLHCLLRVCPPGSTACDFSCNGDVRRRRAVELPEDKSDLRVATALLTVTSDPVYLSPVGAASKRDVVWLLILASVGLSLLDCITV